MSEPNQSESHSNPVNPYEASLIEATVVEQNSDPSPSLNDATYNIVTDTVTGVNLRMSDNLFQAVFILVSVILGAVIVATVALVIKDTQFPWLAGAIVGAFAGLIIGVLASGIVLMIYRGWRHLKGKHN
jgi:hypothetical protein